jgi:signal transduction histidine kinase/ligand-binding sensor domain-containing protein
VLIIGTSAASWAAAQPKGFRVTELTTRDGLSQSIVYSMMQDRHGFLWFGTRDGLDRYDGYTFRSYGHDPFDTTSLSDYIVTAVAEDSAGYVWAGTSAGGLNRLDRRKGTCARYRHDPRRAGTVSSDRIATIAVDRRGTVWVLTDRGLDRFDAASNRFTSIRPTGVSDGHASDSLRLYVDRRGDVWYVASFTVGRSKAPFIDARRSCVIGRLSGARNEPRAWILDLPVGVVTIIGDHPDGTLELAYLGVNFDVQPMTYRFDPRTGRVSRFTIASRIGGAMALAKKLIPLAIDDDGLCWYASAHVARWYGPSGRLTLFAERLIPMDGAGPSAPPSAVAPTAPRPIHACLQFPPIRSRDGTLWFASGSGVAGIARTGTDVTTWRHDPEDSTTLSARRIRGVAFDGMDRLWAATDYGLNRYDTATGKWRRFYAVPGRGLTHSTVNTIYRDGDGSLLLGTNAGISTVGSDGTPMAKRFAGLPRAMQDQLHVWSFVRDRAGHLWIGTGLAGVWVLDAAGNLLRRHGNDPADDRSITTGGVWSLLEDRRGAIWVGTNEGLCRWLPAEGRFRRYLHEPGNRRSIGGARIWSLFEDSAGTLWICSYGGGLSRYNSATDDFTTITTQDGLVSNAVVGVREDSNHDFWIATTKGLVRWDRRRDRFQLYDERDGLQGNEFAFHAFTTGPDGRLYFGGVDGLSAFTPASMRQDPSVPQIVVSAFTVFDSLYSSELVDGDTVCLEHDQNYFSLEFSALSFANPGKNQYAYRLDGLDPSWVNTGAARRVASYTHLEPGTYTFHVRGSNGDGVWNERGAAITIIIAPPWWGTWTFRAIAAIALTGVVITANQSRTRSIRRREREKQKGNVIAALESQESERQRIARDLHDGVGQMIAAAGVNVAFAREMMRLRSDGSPDDELEASLQRSIAILGQASDDVRAISHELGTTSLKELGLVAALAELLGNLDPHQPTRFEFERVGMEERLSEHLEIGLFRVAQELIANVLRHAGATEATLQIVHESAQVSLTVEDNGIGFDHATATHGMGRHNVAARVALMGGNVSYDATPGHGTTVMVTVHSRR